MYQHPAVSLNVYITFGMLASTENALSMKTVHLINLTKQPDFINIFQKSTFYLALVDDDLFYHRTSFQKRIELQKFKYFTLGEEKPTHTLL